MNTPTISPARTMTTDWRTGLPVRIAQSDDPAVAGVDAQTDTEPAAED